MSIAGHILGERKLRRLQREVGLPFDRAYRRGREVQGRTITDGRCEHWSITWGAYTAVRIEQPSHWSSCPGPGRAVE